MAQRGSQPRGQKCSVEVADRLHSAAIHLLRRLRSEDRATGLTGPRLSALSVIVFGGPLPLGDLARAEQVKPPTISRLVRELEAEGLVERIADPEDRRVQRIKATGKGKRLLEKGRGRRVERLAEELSGLDSEERKVLIRAAEILERISFPEGARPRR